MRLRLLRVSAMVLVGACAWLAQTNASGLAFGQAYGTAGFRSQVPASSMADAANVVLVFMAADGHRNVVLTQQTGDYIVSFRQVCTRQEVGILTFILRRLVSLIRRAEDPIPYGFREMAHARSFLAM